MDRGWGPLVLVMILICWSNAASGQSQQDVSDCTTPVTMLLVCLPYVQGKAIIPTPDCCSNVAKIYDTNKKCLCVLIEASFNGGIAQLPPFNTTLALTLAPQCNVNADPTICPGLLGLSPSSPEAKEFIMAKNLTSSSSATTTSSPSPTSSFTNSPANNHGVHFANTQALSIMLMLSSYFLLVKL